MIACVHLPRFELAFAAGGARALVGRPLAIAPLPGVERRVGEVSGAAEAFGVRRGMMLGENFVPALRDYGICAQILLDLGVHEMILLSNTERTIVALEGYGLNAVERRPIAAPEG